VFLTLTNTNTNTHHIPDLTSSHPHYTQTPPIMQPIPQNLLARNSQKTQARNSPSTTYRMPFIPRSARTAITTPRNYPSTYRMPFLARNYHRTAPPMPPMPPTHKAIYAIIAYPCFWLGASTYHYIEDSVIYARSEEKKEKPRFGN
jgi:hypothetical protein